MAIKEKGKSVHLAIVNGNGLNEVREYKELTISLHQDTFPKGEHLTDVSLCLTASVIAVKRATLVGGVGWKAPRFSYFGLPKVTQY